MLFRSHALQGLDVVCFAVMKQYWAEEVEKFEEVNKYWVTGVQTCALSIWYPIAARTGLACGKGNELTMELARLGAICCGDIMCALKG